MFISVAGVIIHVLALFAGPAWFIDFHAPASVVASARAGTWLAPFSALVIAGLMAVCACYAASTLGLTRRPPFQRSGLAAIALVCLLRALILPFLAIAHPELRTTFEIIAALIWGLAGLGFALALASLVPGARR